MEPSLPDQTESAERGATATEYAVMLGFIALAIVVGVTAFGVYLGQYYTEAAQHVHTLLGLP